MDPARCATPQTARRNAPEGSSNDERGSAERTTLPRVGSLGRGWEFWPGGLAGIYQARTILRSLTLFPVGPVTTSSCSARKNVLASL